jgi:hypothetical protein
MPCTGSGVMLVLTISPSGVDTGARLQTECRRVRHGVAAGAAADLAEVFAAPRRHLCRNAVAWVHAAHRMASSLQALQPTTDAVALHGAPAVGVWRCSLGVEPARHHDQRAREIRDAARHPHHEAAHLLVLQRIEAERGGRLDIERIPKVRREREQRTQRAGVGHGGEQRQHRRRHPGARKIVHQNTSALARKLVC